jgi:hypothetical protein
MVPTVGAICTNLVAVGSDEGSNKKLIHPSVSALSLLKLGISKYKLPLILP